MTQQFVHNVTPGPRQFVTQASGRAAHVVNGGRPTIDSRHLAAPGVPVSAASPFVGPEFERNARALVALVDMYANAIKASGSVPAGITVEDLKQLPMARLQQLYYAAPLKPPTANAGTKPGGSYVTELARYSLNSPNGAADPYASYPDNPGADGRGRYDLNNPMGDGLPD
jgi:hypothetical protein